MRSEGRKAERARTAGVIIPMPPSNRRDRRLGRTKEGPRAVLVKSDQKGLFKILWEERAKGSRQIEEFVIGFGTAVREFAEREGCVR